MVVGFLVVCFFREDLFWGNPVVVDCFCVVSAFVKKHILGILDRVSLVSCCFLCNKSFRGRSSRGSLLLLLCCEQRPPGAIQSW